MARCLVCSYEWLKSPEKVQAKRGCPNCAGLLVTQQQWDERAKASGVEWLAEVPNAHTRTEARCLTCGHKEALLPSGVGQGSGCPKCAGKRLTQADWDARAKERGFEWLAPVKRSHDKTPVRCLTCGYEWSVNPSNRTGCPACKKVARVTPEQWDERAKAVGIEWLELVKHALSPTSARCLSCGLEYKARPGNVTNGRGCSACARQAAGIRRRVPREKLDELAEQRGLELLSEGHIPSSSQTPARCLTCGYEWNAWPASIKVGHGCPRCSGKAATQRDWIDRADTQGIEWLEPVVQANTKALAKCRECGLEWMVVPSSIRDGTGCPSCAQYGIDLAAPTTLYLLIRSDGVAKVGITNQGKAQTARMKRLGKLGYEVHTTWAFPDGHKALAAEQDIIRQWREEDQLLPAADEGEDGFTETVHTDSLSLHEISRRLNEIVRAT